MFPPGNPPPAITPTNPGIIGTLPPPTPPTTNGPMLPGWVFNGWAITPPNNLSKDAQIAGMQYLMNKMFTDLTAYQTALLAYDQASSAAEGLKANRDLDQAAFDSALLAFNNYKATVDMANITQAQQMQLDMLSGPVFSAGLNLGLANAAYNSSLTTLPPLEAAVNAAKSQVGVDMSLLGSTWTNIPSKFPMVSGITPLR